MRRPAVDGGAAGARGRRLGIVTLALALALPAVAADADDAAASRACWRRVTTIDPASSLAPDQVAAVVDRLLATAHGRSLLIDLCSLFPGATTPGAAPIRVVFTDKLSECGGDSDGCFEPATPGSASYQVNVRVQRSAAARAPTVFLFGEYPGNSRCDVVIFYEQAASMMAETLYHELLHVWFVNATAGQHRRFPTGHGAVARCEFETDFLEALRAEAAELAELEGRGPRPGLRPTAPSR